ncbi:MAG: hypothetical protein WC528_02100 [Patescibacteria group bacterium]
MKFNVSLFRNFDQVNLNIGLNNISQDNISLYAQGGVDRGEYEQIVRNQFLDELDWDYIIEDGYTLWQRPAGGYRTLENLNPEDTEPLQVEREAIHYYQSISEFMKNMPAQDKIGIVGLPQERFYRVKDYVSNNLTNEINHYFRGGHVLYTYIDKEDNFVLRFNKIDLDREMGHDDLVFKMYLGNKLVFSKLFADNGITPETENWGNAQDCLVEDIDFDSGLYKIVIETNDDVIFGEIESSQKYLSFFDHIFLADGPNYSSGLDFQQTEILTDSENIKFDTPHESGAQQYITIGGDSNMRSIYIGSPKTVYPVSNLGGRNAVKLQKSSIYISGNNFSFENFELIPPFVKKPFINVKNNIDGIDYILAVYKPQKTFGSILVSANYDLDKLFKKDNNIYFNLRAPDLYKNKEKIEINYIEVELIGEPLTFQKIYQKLVVFFKAIF